MLRNEQFVAVRRIRTLEDRLAAASCAARAIKMYVRVLRIHPTTQLQKRKETCINDASLLGSGRRIRTLTYGVRVRCATITQSRCVLTNINYYTHQAGFVNTLFSFFEENLS